MNQPVVATLLSEPETRSTALPVPFAADAFPPELAALVERLEDYARAAQGAFADNTARALAADVRVFAAWCQ
jgi:hypothetical protein